MALVDYGQKIFREIVEQTEWPGARFAAVEISRIILDAAAMSQLLDHFEIIRDTLLEARSFNLTALTVEKLDLFAQVKRYLVHSRRRTLLARHENVGRINIETFQSGQHSAGVRIYRLNLLDLVAPEYNPKLDFLERKTDIHRIALDTELSPAQLGLRPVV